MGDIPDGVECKVKARVVTIKGPRGTLVRSFRHLAIDIYMEGPTKLTVEKHFGKRKENAAIRKVRMHEGVTCENSKDQKDELTVTGNSIEAVSQSVALIQQSTTVKNKDIRKFLDGLYISGKGHVVED